MNITTLNMTTLDGGNVIIKRGEGGGSTPTPPSGGGETLYFAAKDGGAIGDMAEMAYMGCFAVKKADDTISSTGLFLTADNFTNETLRSIKAMAFALGNYSSGGGADISNPDTLRAMMFQFNGVEGFTEIIEITKEQFYNIE
jgi:hypothetical protein